MKAVGCHQAVARCHPADQGFHSGQRPARLDQRLVVQDEAASALAKVLAKVCFDLVAFGQALLQRLVVELKELAPRCFAW